MANEFVARLGLIARESSQMSGSLDVTGSLKVTGSAHIQSANISNATLSNVSATGVISANASIRVSDSVGTSNVSQLIFNNANNVTFGINNGTVTATAAAGGAGAIESYYHNMNVINGTGTAVWTWGSATNYIQPFVLPYDISGSYLRVIMTNSWVSTILPSSTTTVSAFYTFAETYYANLYSQGSGANSLSLQLAQAISATQQHGISVTFTATNAQTIRFSFGYPVTGDSSTYQTSYNVSTSNIPISTTLHTQFNGIRFLDFPVKTSIPAGGYWIAFQRSTSSNSGIINALSACVHNNSLYYVTNPDIRPVQFGANSTTGNQPLLLGLGSFSVTNNGVTTNSVDITAISTRASQVVVPFQIVRIG